MHKRKQHLTSSGFTLLETLICTLLITIGVGSWIAMALSGRSFLKQAEDKSRAINLASVKMEGCLTKSYSGLEVGTTTGAEGPLDGTIFNWTTNVTQEYEPPEAASLLPDQVRLPYKKIEVIASYAEAEPQGTKQTKQVRLENLIPYPFVHTAHISLTQNTSATVPFSDPAKPTYQSIGLSTDILKLNVNYPITKDIMVMYNIAISVEDNTGIDAIHTIYTGCFLDDEGPRSVATRTPIMSQPLISLALVLEAVAPKDGGHDIEIKWFKDVDSGKVTLREANLIIIATEKK